MDRLLSGGATAQEPVLVAVLSRDRQLLPQPLSAKFPFELGRFMYTYDLVVCDATSQAPTRAVVCLHPDLAVTAEENLIRAGKCILISSAFVFNDEENLANRRVVVVRQLRLSDLSVTRAQLDAMKQLPWHPSSITDGRPSLSRGTFYLPQPSDDVMHTVPGWKALQRPVEQATLVLQSLAQGSSASSSSSSSTGGLVTHILESVQLPDGSTSRPRLYVGARPRSLHDVVTSAVLDGELRARQRAANRSKMSSKDGRKAWDSHEERGDFDDYDGQDGEAEQEEYLADDMGGDIDPTVMSGPAARGSGTLLPPSSKQQSRSFPQYKPAGKTGGSGGGEKALRQVPLLGRLARVGCIKHSGSPEGTVNKATGVARMQGIPFRFSFVISDDTRSLHCVAWNAAAARWHDSLAALPLGTPIALVGYRVKVLNGQHEVSLNARYPTAFVYQFSEDDAAAVNAATGPSGAAAAQGSSAGADGGSGPGSIPRLEWPNLYFHTLHSLLSRGRSGQMMSVAGFITRVGPICREPALEPDYWERHDKPTPRQYRAPSSGSSGGAGAGAGDAGAFALSLACEALSSTTGALGPGPCRGPWQVYRWVWLRDPTTVFDVPLKVYANSNLTTLMALEADKPLVATHVTLVTAPDPGPALQPPPYIFYTPTMLEEVAEGGLIPPRPLFLACSDFTCLALGVRAPEVAAQPRLVTSFASRIPEVADMLAWRAEAHGENSWFAVSRGKLAMLPSMVNAADGQPLWATRHSLFRPSSLIEYAALLLGYRPAAMMALAPKVGSSSGAGAGVGAGAMVVQGEGNDDQQALVPRMVVPPGPALDVPKLRALLQAHTNAMNGLLAQGGSGPSSSSSSSSIPNRWLGLPEPKQAAGGFEEAPPGSVISAMALATGPGCLPLQHLQMFRCILVARVASVQEVLPEPAPEAAVAVVAAAAAAQQQKQEGAPAATTTVAAAAPQAKDKDKEAPRPEPAARRRPPLPASGASASAPAAPAAGRGPQPVSRSRVAQAARLQEEARLFVQQQSGQQQRHGRAGRASSVPPPQVKQRQSISSSGRRGDAAAQPQGRASSAASASASSAREEAVQRQRGGRRSSSVLITTTTAAAAAAARTVVTATLQDPSARMSFMQSVMQRMRSLFAGGGGGGEKEEEEGEEPAEEEVMEVEGGEEAEEVGEVTMTAATQSTAKKRGRGGKRGRASSIDEGTQTEQSQLQSAEVAPAPPAPPTPQPIPGHMTFQPGPRISELVTQLGEALDDAVDDADGDGMRLPSQPPSPPPVGPMEAAKHAAFCATLQPTQPKPGFKPLYALSVSELNAPFSTLTLALNPSALLSHRDPLQPSVRQMVVLAPQQAQEVDKQPSSEEASAPVSKKKRRGSRPASASSEAEAAGGETPATTAAAVVSDGAGAGAGASSQSQSQLQQLPGGTIVVADPDLDVVRSFFPPSAPADRHGFLQYVTSGDRRFAFCLTVQQRSFDQPVNPATGRAYTIAELATMTPAQVSAVLGHPPPRPPTVRIEAIYELRDDGVSM